MPLHLVHPTPVKQRTRRSKGGRSATLSLTEEETRHFRAALRNTARAYGGMPVLAGVVGVPVGTLHQALSKRGRRPSAELARFELIPLLDDYLVRGVLGSDSHELAAVRDALDDIVGSHGTISLDPTYFQRSAAAI
jgi:hypothetical protein